MRGIGRRAVRCWWETVLREVRGCERPCDVVVGGGAAEKRQGGEAGGPVGATSRRGGGTGSRLCAREDFDFPVARVLSETGRHSRHPVYVVGIFSGTDKLGEAAGASLREAKTRAAIAALKAWYMYSPVAGQGTSAPVPSDVEEGGSWEGAHIDMGEIAAC